MGTDKNAGTGKRSDMKIGDELEPLTVYYYDVSAAIDRLVRHVLKIIPDHYTEEFPSFSVFERYSRWGAHVEEEGNIFCDPSLLNLPWDVAIGTLAHEFAHVFLGHTGKGGLGDEREADALACRWGFRKQIEAIRKIYGPPTED